jgi:hypothetical protein
VQGQTAPQQQDIAKQRSGATDSLREIITVSAEASKEIPSIGDQLAENLIAQSLDLPPKAAKVRSVAELGGQFDDVAVLKCPIYLAVPQVQHP